MANETVRNFVKEALSNEADALLSISQHIGEEYEKAIDLIAACQGKVVVTGIGKSGHIGKKIAASLSSTGTPSFFVHSAEAVHGDSGMIDKRDVVILLSNSGETQEVLNLLPIVEKIGAARIAITKNADSTLGRRSDVALTYHYRQEADHLGLAPTTSALLQLAIGDALAVVLCRMKGFSKEDFYLYHPGGSLGQQLSKETKQA
ncbi:MULTISPECIES: SIS domain-containing protein [unclassified Paenibacillus]|uniref:KpsF/GutQ family sugar-phosphate isomerase n=1 Tax=unclassified Paenibacillus TaxID=185978 RepID=UPI001C10DC75|nr:MULTISPECIES: SIS domain-containing protein [unclassified Paenibacillus]MBU5444937.1 SIS domain-containing protein [Paenibacillus sp. MSJ-34]CAH0120660.1 Arabinose 5-phosphate isomerase KdsD [Paenibacillus sp. CECT 9249]